MFALHSFSLWISVTDLQLGLVPPRLPEDLAELSAEGDRPQKSQQPLLQARARRTPPGTQSAFHSVLLHHLHIPSFFHSSMARKVWRKIGVWRDAGFYAQVLIQFVRKLKCSTSTRREKKCYDTSLLSRALRCATYSNRVRWVSDDIESWSHEHFISSKLRCPCREMNFAIQKQSLMILIYIILPRCTLAIYIFFSLCMFRIWWRLFFSVDTML